MNRFSSRYGFGLVFSLALVSAVFLTPAAARTVNFAYNTPTLSGTLPIVVAQDFGFFAAEGLEVKTVFIRGGPTAMAALVGGGFDYTYTPYPPRLSELFAPLGN